MSPKTGLVGRQQTYRQTNRQRDKQRDRLKRFVIGQHYQNIDHKKFVRSLMNIHPAPNVIKLF